MDEPAGDTLPFIIVFPAFENKAVLPAADPKLFPPTTLPFNVIVPDDDLRIVYILLVLDAFWFPLNVGAVMVKLQLPVYDTVGVVVFEFILLTEVIVTVPVVADIVRGVVLDACPIELTLPDMLPLLKLNVPPAVIPVPDVLFNDNTSKLVSTFTVNVLLYTSSAVVGRAPVFHTVVSDQLPFFTALTAAIYTYLPANAAICAPVLAIVALLLNLAPIVDDPVKLVTGVFHISFDIL